VSWVASRTGDEACVGTLAVQLNAARVATYVGCAAALASARGEQCAAGYGATFVR